MTMRILNASGRATVPALVASAVAAWRRAIVRVNAASPRAARAGWESAAEERFPRSASDGAVLEQRQRSWARDEADAYRLSGWS